MVALGAPSLANAVHKSRALNARAKAGRLDLRTPTSVAYLGELARTQDALAARIVAAIPEARVRWRYRIVLDGLAVVVPRDRLQELSSLPGITQIYPSSTYREQLDMSPELIGADQLWGLPDFTTAGNGLKIAILDDGIDPSHPFFNPTGYTYPPGFPKGNLKFTSPKVIVARAFASPSTNWKYAKTPFDPVYSFHGEHVAGIAAGEYSVDAVPSRGPLSGVAPKAYLGNYKVLTAPDVADGGIDGNAPEIAAAIEAAVADGMDVINLSIGEVEVEPSRDVVVQAIDGAAEAGVTSAAAAFNDFDLVGRGGISSPANAPAAIAVAAVSKTDVIAFFSSSGPTPIGLQFKPDVSAPGQSILSSVPAHEGTWQSYSGTSMAAPHVAGGVALLRQRHPDWTVAQLKSALVLTGDPVYADAAHTKEVPTTREGGGLINLPRANDPLVFASPTGLSFELLKVGTQATRSIDLTDAGGGAGDWTVTVQPQDQVAGLTVSAPPTVTVPGRIDVVASASANAEEADATGFVVLQHGTDTRRIPYWLRTERPRLSRPTETLVRPGIYSGNTRGKPARVSSYRYPDDPRGLGLTNHLVGPEQIFQVKLTRNVANFGVAVLSHAPGVRVTPRVVSNGDENRLTGYPGLPGVLNPYLSTYPDPEPVVGAILPAPGIYDVVFDTVSAASAGRFTFAFWVDDTTPPQARLLTRSTRRGGKLLLSVTDSGAGVDPASFNAKVDATTVTPVYSAADGQATITLPLRLGPGRHQLSLQVSDYQEAKNMEDVGPILPNTRTLHATITIRP